VNVTAYNCTICNTTVPGSTFWGFVSAIINFDSLVNGTDSRLKELVNLGYNYEMKAQQPAGGTLMIAKHGPSPTDPVTATVHIPNGDWTLYVQPQAGWVPGWRDPMLAAVVVVGCLLGVLLTCILAGQHMQRLLLRETQVSGCCRVCSAWVESVTRCRCH
jgi:sensor domain CHASE-containing protein